MDGDVHYIYGGGAILADEPRSDELRRCGPGAKPASFRLRSNIQGEQQVTVSTLKSRGWTGSDFPSSAPSMTRVAAVMPIRTGSLSGDNPHGNPVDPIRSAALQVLEGAIEREDRDAAEVAMSVLKFLVEVVGPRHSVPPKPVRG